MFSKYYRQFLTIIILCMIFVSGCGRKKEDSDGVHLLYWSSSNPFEIQLGRELVAKWNILHPETLVTIQPLPEGRSGEEVLIIAAAGGTAPDICSNVPPVVVPLLARAKALVPIDQFDGGRDYLSQRIPSQLESNFIASDGKLYQVPWKGNPILVQYNMGILREVGVEKLPETWSEWNNLAEKVSSDLDGDGQYDRWMADLNIISEWRQRLFDFYTFYIAASGGMTLLKNGKIDYDNKHSLEVFEFFAHGFNKQYYAKSIFVGDMFMKSKIAAHITGPWNISHVERFKPEGFEYAFGPIPVPDDYKGDKYTFGDPKSIGIFSTSKHPEAAWDFVKYIISEESDLRLLEICNQLPLRKNLTTDSLFADYFAGNPNMELFAEQVPLTRGFDQNPVLQEVFDSINEQFDACCIHGKREPAEALRLAVKRSRNVLKARGI